MIFFYVFFSKEYSRGSAILARHIDTSCKGKFPICLDQQTTIIVRCLQYVRVAYSLWIINSTISCVEPDNKVSSGRQPFGVHTTDASLQQSRFVQ